jgi:arsenite-transporting ATPase
VAATTVHSSLLRQRAANELPEIAAVANRYASRYALVPLLQDEPTGVERLSALAGGDAQTGKRPAKPEPLSALNTEQIR